MFIIANILGYYSAKIGIISETTKKFGCFLILHEKRLNIWKFQKECLSLQRYLYVKLNSSAYETEKSRKMCEIVQNVCRCRTFYLLLPMKTEFGKWLMDIAKYMVTALLLSTVFAEMNDPIILYIVVLLTMIVLGYGLYWVNEGKKEELKKKRR